MQIPTNEEKNAVWQAYYSGKTTRIPLRWNTNVRVWLFDPALNTEGFTYQQCFEDPKAALEIFARFSEYETAFFSQSSDRSDVLPEMWSVFPDAQNCTDGAFFGGKIIYPSGQVPGVEPFLSIDEVDDFLARDFVSSIEKNPFLVEQLRRTAELRKAAKDFSYAGRKTRVYDFIPWSDGPLTFCMTAFGTDFLLLLAEEPEKCRRVFLKVTDDLLARHRYLCSVAEVPPVPGAVGMADDSIAMISCDTYRSTLLDIHKHQYDVSSEGDLSRRRTCHLCGDATRHFKSLVDVCGVQSFDTGFPVNHGALRRELGPDIEISGGPHVGLLERKGASQECYNEAKRILQSGICEGGRFILQEGNNLPPLCPLENLQAVYQACLEFGWVNKK